MSRVLLLLGSPKPGRSTSGSLLDYVGKRLQARGWEEERIHLNQTMTLKRGVDHLFAAVDRADLVVLGFPLYIDGVPANALRALEAIADRPRPVGIRSPPGFVAIVNSGFPEAVQSATALATCREFAREAGFRWGGGLALGGGGTIDGRPLETVGSMARNIRASLDLAADALAAGRAIPEEAVALMARPLVPPWLYRRIGHLGWRHLARAHGVARRIWDRPYEPGRETGRHAWAEGSPQTD